jgi:hypothetical protein
MALAVLIAGAGAGEFGFGGTSSAEDHEAFEGQAAEGQLFVESSGGEGEWHEDEEGEEEEHEGDEEHEEDEEHEGDERHEDEDD